MASRRLHSFYDLDLSSIPSRIRNNTTDTEIFALQQGLPGVGKDIDAKLLRDSRIFVNNG